MPDPYAKVTPGQEITINSGVWNSCIDAARAQRNRHQSRMFEPGETFRQGSIIRVKNGSGAGLLRSSVLGVTAPLILPGDNLEVFQNEVLFGAAAPSATSPGRFVILIEPIGNGNIGRAMIAGVCQVKVNIVNAAHIWCECATGVTANLVSGATGSSELIWQESGLGVKWAVVRIGNRCNA